MKRPSPSSYIEVACHFCVNFGSAPFTRVIPLEKGGLISSFETFFGVELKAVDELTAIHRAQVISYLRALDKPLGLLINFNVPLLKDGLRRIILSA